MLRLKFLPLMCIKELWVQGFCLKRADSDHYSYPECGLKFLVLKRVPKVLNCLERRPKLLTVCKADVFNLVFISPRPLWINESLETEESAHVHVCPGRAFVTVTGFQKVCDCRSDDADYVCRGKVCLWAPHHQLALSDVALTLLPFLPYEPKPTVGL